MIYFTKIPANFFGQHDRFGLLVSILLSYSNLIIELQVEYLQNKKN